MSTREEIIALADTYIREKGYNAFSFQDISRDVGIKTASIHYHFPQKADLGIAVIDLHSRRLKELMVRCEGRSPVEQLEQLFSIYSKTLSEHKVCVVGALATDLFSFDESIGQELKAFSALLLGWVSGFLEEGRTQGLFRFAEAPRTRALLLLGNLLSVVQLARLTGKKDFKTVVEALRQNLLQS